MPAPVQTAPFRPTWADWLPPAVWTCPRCGAEQHTRAASPRCSVCGFREAAD